jgi:hypothetical protein
MLKLQAQAKRGDLEAKKLLELMFSRATNVEAEAGERLQRE